MLISALPDLSLGKISTAGTLSTQISRAAVHTQFSPSLIGGNRSRNALWGARYEILFRGLPTQPANPPSESTTSFVSPNILNKFSRPLRPCKTLRSRFATVACRSSLRAVIDQIGRHGTICSDCCLRGRGGERGQVSQTRVTARRFETSTERLRATQRQINLTYVFDILATSESTFACGEPVAEAATFTCLRRGVVALKFVRKRYLSARDYGKELEPPNLGSWWARRVPDMTDVV